MWKVLGVVMAGTVVSAGYGQSLLDNVSFRSMSLGGVHLYGVSVYSGYSTSAFPGGSAVPGIGASALLDADINYGAGASLGWQFHRPRTNLSLFYSGSYGGQVRYSDANGYSQSLSFSASRTLSTKWTASLSMTGSDMTTAQFLFQPTNASLISQSSATFDDLAAAFNIGQFSNSQIASMLTSMPVLESPSRSFLLGDRVLNYGANGSLNYAHSSRLSFHLSSFSAAGQHRNSGNEPVAQDYVMSRSFGVSGGVGMSYMVSPRTSLGLDAQVSRINNQYQVGYSSTAGASIGRKMGQRWFLAANAGAATNHLVRQTYGTPKSVQLTMGGSLGFRTYQHTLLGTYNRSGSDPYGFALGTNTAISAAWTWRRPGSRWSLFSNFTEQQVRNTGFVSLSGWSAGGGASTSLVAQTFLTVQYAYLSNAGAFIGGNTRNSAIHSVRLSLGWTPQEMTH